MYIIICTIYTTVQRKQTYTITIQNVYNYMYNIYNKGNNKITELRAILQRESQNS